MGIVMRSKIVVRVKRRGIVVNGGDEEGILIGKDGRVDC